MTDHPAPNPNQPDALVEKARAEAEKRYPTGLPGTIREDDDEAEMHQDAYVEGYLAAAAVLPEVERHAKADALREAADTWTHGAWADAPRCADRVQERIANGQHVGDWLRARADQIDKGDGRG